MSGALARLADLEPLRRQLEAVAGSEARLALARARDKAPVDKGWLEKPLTPEQEQEWDKEIAKGDGAHFKILLRQCEPPLLAVDIDDPSNSYAKELLTKAREEGWWLAPSKTKGFHILVQSDIGTRELMKGEAALRPLVAPRANARPCGELLTNAAVAYRPGDKRKVLPLCEAEGLFTLLTGKPLSPRQRLDGMLERIGAEIDNWPEGARHNSMFRLCVTMSRRLKTIGAWGEVGKVAEHIAKHYKRLNPEDTMDTVKVRELIEKFDDGSSEDDLPATTSARLLRSVYEQIKDRHAGHLYIDGGTSSNKLRAVHAWDMVGRDWFVTTYQAKTEGRASFASMIGRVVDNTYLDLVGEVPDLGKKHDCVEAVWEELLIEHSEKHLHLKFDNPPASAKVNYFNIGEGKVLRVSADAGDFRRGEAVREVANEPEYLAAQKMVTPSANEDKEFAKRIYEVWPEDGVADYLRMRWAEMLVPHVMHTPDFITFYGEGGNGKSMIHDALLAAFGEFGTTVDVNAVKKTQGEPPVRTLGARGTMVGKRLVIMHEAGKDAMDEEVLKEIVAGNPVRVGKLYQDPHMAAIHAKLCIMSNKPIRLDGVGAAMARRACQVGCNQCFDDGVREDVDREMPLRLVAGAAGILRMIINDIKEYLGWRHDNPGRMLPKPTAIKDQTKEWLDGQAPYQSALRRFFVPSEGDAAPKMVQGSMKKDGGSTGLTSVVDALTAEYHRCNPVKEVKTFVRRTDSKGKRGTDIHLSPTEAFADWCATSDIISDNDRDLMFFGVFRNSSHGRKVYDKMFYDAVDRAAAVKQAEERDPAPEPETKEEEIPWN